MSDRSGPVLEAHACPFVAFDDDRDRRSEEPDHRHRCFAEPRPAPRALAHQRAYCLSSAFPSCPIFQDWARREAARAVPAGAGFAGGVAAGSTLADEADVEADEAEAESEAAGSSRSRSWATPPPWMSGSPATAAGREPGDRPASSGRAGERRPSEGAGPAPADDEGADREDLPADASAVEPVAPSFLARREHPPAPQAEPQPRPVAPVDPDSGFFAGSEPAEPWADSRDFDEEEAGGRGQRGRMGVGGALPSPRRARPSGRSIDATRRRLDDSPAWEPRRRMEAYPTLKTRIGLPNLGGRALALIAVLVAAVALFFLPMLFTGHPSGTTGGTPTPSAAAASPSASASEVAASPSAATVYVVKSGDVLSRVATKLGVSLDALIAANPQLKDPNKLQIGDRLNIPTTPPSEIPNGSPASPSPS